MTDFLARIKPKRSTVTGEVPSPQDLELAEIAVNTADGILFTKHSDGTIKSISGGGGGGNIEGLNNVSPRQIISLTTSTWTGDDAAVSGGWNYDGTTVTLNKENSAAVDVRTYISGLPASGTFYWSSDGATLETTSYTNLTINASEQIAFDADVTDATDPGTLYAAWENPMVTGPSFDNDVLVYNATSSNWEPRALQNFVGLYDLSDVVSQDAKLAGWIWETPGANGSQTAGEYKIPEGNNYFSYSLQSAETPGTFDTARQADMASLQVGDDIEFTFNNGEIVQTTVSNVQSANSGTYNFFIRVAGAFSAIHANDSGPLLVYSSRFSGGSSREVLDPETVAPDGSVLTWSSYLERWQPSVLTIDNTNRIQDQADFELHQTGPASHEFTSFATGLGFVPDADYEWGVYNGELRLWHIAADDTDLRSIFDTLPSPGSVWWSNNGLSWTEATYTSADIHNDGTTSEYLRLMSTSPLPTTLSGSLYVTFTTPGANVDVPLAEGEILQWVAAEGKFKPAQITTTSLDSLTDVDTSTVAPADGQALVWDDSASEWKPGTVSGGAGSVMADLNDVEASTPSDGQILYMDNGVYKHSIVSQFLSGRATVTGAISTTVTNDTGMAGTNGFYADTAAMEADGFIAVGGTDVDDQVISIPTADFVDYSQVDYLARGLSNLYFCRINSNGSVYLNETAINRTSRTGNFNNDHGTEDLVVAWASEDTEVRRAGYKEITQDGTDWFVVRADMKVPYNNETGGYPLETWFGKDGRIRQYFGTKIGSGSNLTIGDTRQGVAGSGTFIAQPNADPDPNKHLSAQGGQRVEYVSAGTLFGFAGAVLEDLSDVGTPVDGEALTYDAATTSWTTTAIPQPTVAPVDSVNGETGAVSLGIQEMDDFELNFTLTGGVTLTPRRDPPGSDFPETDGWNAINAFFIFNRNNPNRSEFLTLSVGDDITFTFDGGTPFITTVQAGLGVNSTNTDYIKVNGTWPSAMSTATSVEISSPSFLGGSTDPLADGDVLQWVAADSKFKPAQLSAGSVDSVNGETGVVSLGIQDMDDFDLVQGAASDGPWSTGASAANSPGHWREFADATNRLIFWNFQQDDGTDVSLPYLALVDGDTIQLSGDNVNWHSFTMEGAAQNNGGTEVRIKTVEDPSIVQTFSTLYVAASVFDVSLAEGDILQWNNADQKFKPAQLATVATSGSYNDLTDKPTLVTSINGLTDVDTATAAPTNNQVLAWDGTNWVPADQSGGGGGGGSSTIVAPFAFGHLNSTASGTGVGVSWGAYDAGTGNVSVTFDTAQADTSYVVVTDCESADDVGASVGSKSTTGFTLSFYDFSSGNPASPSVHPQTFQVFTSSGTQQVAGGGSGGGAVDSVNGQTGVVSLDVFDLTNVEKVPNVATTTFFYNSGSCSSPTGDGSSWANGAIRTDDNNGFLYAADLDANGEDFRAAVVAKVAAFGTPLPFWTSADGATNWTQYSSTTDPASNANRLDFQGGNFTDCSRPIYITLEDPAGASPVVEPLAGEVLTWNSTDQKFRPAQLPAAPVASVNGETGAVSLGIQEMDDFGLYLLGETVTAATQIFSATFNPPSSPDQYNIHASSDNAIYVSSILNGTDESTRLDALAGETVTLSIGGVSVTGTVSSVADRSSGASKLLSTSFSLASLRTADSSLPLVIRYTPWGTTDIPLAEGDVLQWHNVDQKFKPAQLPAAPVDSVNGETGAVSLDLGSITDVTTSAFPTALGTDFDPGEPIFVDKGVAGAAGGSLDTTLGTNAWKLPATDYYGTSETLGALFGSPRRYEIVCLKIRSTNAFDTNNRMCLGGNKAEISSGAGWTLYTRDTGFGFYFSGNFQEVGTRPTMAADTWHEVTYVLDWSSSLRTADTLPAISLWVDGAIAINNVTPTGVTYSPIIDPKERAQFRLAYSNVSQTSSGDKYIDFVRVASTATLPWSMTDATLSTTGRALVDAMTAEVTFGDALVYNGSQWVPSGSTATMEVPPYQLNQLDDVSYVNGAFKPDLLDRIYFSSDDVPANGADDNWGIYANGTYGVAVGEYNVTATLNATRTFYSPTRGIIHNSGRNQLHWLMGTFDSTTNTPELRWTSGNPEGPTGNHVGIKLPAGISENTTYTLPLADGTADQVLSTDGSGALSWATPAVSLADLSDISYSSGSLEPTGLDQIVFSGSDVPAGSIWKLYTSSGGIGLGSFDSGFTASWLDVHQNNGIALKGSGGTISFHQTGGGTPNLKLYDSDDLAGNFVGFTIGLLSGSTTYELPSADGTSGQVLSTDGTGVISWIDNETISLAALKAEVAASTDFADFQSRIAAL